MRTLKTQGKYSDSIAGKIVVALALALLIGVSAGPAFAQDRYGPPERGGHRGYDERARRDHRRHRPVRVYQPPPPPVVYAPPPVIYAPPPPSPGISIIFPIHIR
jgi:hypothetical protein